MVELEELCQETIFTSSFSHALEQQSLTFLLPGTGFVDDNFSMDGAGGQEAELRQ